jgi:hypothetical protein
MKRLYHLRLLAPERKTALLAVADGMSAVPGGAVG